MIAPETICVYPLSPTYLPFHRYLYYCSLFLSVAYPTPPPFIKGAFAYSLTYSATASLYAILITAQNTSAALVNLDIFGLWSVLSAACTLLLPLLSWNKNLQSDRGKSARSIVRIWGVWTTIGTICTLASMIQARQRVVETTGLENLASCLASSAASGGMKFRLRDPRTIEIGQYNEVFRGLYGAVVNYTVVFTFIPLFFGLVLCLKTISPARPKSPADVYTGICVSSPEGTFSSCTAARAAYLLIQRTVSLASPCFFIAGVVVNERFLLRSWVPAAEQMYEIGQWGLLAGLGLVSAAAVVNWIVGRTLERVDLAYLYREQNEHISAEIIA